MFSQKANSDSVIKEPNVSGQFYDANSSRLSSQIDRFFNLADVNQVKQHVDILIAPHAGYVYSGAVAAHSFKAVSANKYNAIVILAPSHYFGFSGISVWTKGGFKTPLGIVEVDQEFAQGLTKNETEIYDKPEVFEKEHSLEVEIPFIQRTFPGVKIVPVIMGQPSFKLLEKFSEKLNSLIGQRGGVLIVVSTDLSHYHDDGTARRMDGQAIEAVKGLQAEKIFEQCATREMEMCGCIPVTAAVLLAKQKELDTVDVLRYANSGDVTADKSRVVGYTSIIMYKKSFEERAPAINNKNEKQNSTLGLEQKKRLLEIAVDTINEFVKSGKVPKLNEVDPRLQNEEGAFVTIHNHGRLRGCIGNIIGQGPLYKTIQKLAILSSSKDTRFDPVKESELKDLDIEVSVLTKPRIIKNVDEIILGIHGVIVSKGPSHSGVFLPQVATETGWSKEEFLSQLCSQKAGLPADCWKNPKTQIEIFTAEVFSEKDLN